MLFLFILLFVGGYALVASWALLRGSVRRLWLVATGAVVLIVFMALLLGRLYAVPSQERLVVFFLGLLTPVVVVPTVFLSFRAASRIPALGRSLLGAVVGLLCGFLLVVYGLRVW